MAFNSDTYHANKAARTSREALAEARKLKAAIAAGEHFYEWQKPLEKISLLARVALSYARLSRTYRDIAATKRRSRR